MPNLKKITPFLATRDLAATIAFYTKHLGFKVETLDPPDSPTFCILDHGDCSLIFDATLWNDPPKLTGQIHIEVDDVAAIHAAIRDHAKILWGPEVFSYGRREFSCQDPNGYALVFSERTNDPPSCSDKQ